MNKTILPLAIVAASTVLLSGCCSTSYKTKEILEEDRSKIVMTINKDLSTTMINANTGERIAPCSVKVDPGAPLAKLSDQISKCLPEGHELPGSNDAILTKGEYLMWKGSYCFAGIDGSGYLYVYCQPPLDLGFPY